MVLLIEMINKSMADFEIESLVQKYNLSPHPEGGWYRRVFQSNDSVIVQGEAIKRYNNEPRLAGTSIIYLLEQHDFSAWHSIQSDETWCFHTGNPLLLRVLDNAGNLQEIILSHDSGHLQFTVRAGDIFSAESLGKFSLVSCVVTPGFDFKDFQLISKDEFLMQYPQHQTLSKFIRDKVNKKDRSDLIPHLQAPLSARFSHLKS